MSEVFNNISVALKNVLQTISTNTSSTSKVPITQQKRNARHRLWRFACKERGIALRQQKGATKITYALCSAKKSPHYKLSDATLLTDCHSIKLSLT